MKKNCCAIFFISIILLIAQPSNCFDANQYFFDSYHIYQGLEADETFGSGFVEALPTDPSELQTFFEALPTNSTELPTFFSWEDYEPQYSDALPPLLGLTLDITYTNPLDHDTFQPTDYIPLLRHENLGAQHYFDPATQQPSAAAVATSSLILSTSRKRGRANTTHPCNHPGCTHAYARISDLNRHLDMHNGIMRFACTFTGCSQSFARSDQLVIHMSPGHGRKNPHKCTICAKAYARMSDLTKHRAAYHSGTKQFACTTTGCAESFVRNEQLNLHMISAHGHEKPHECPTCSVTFARKGDLTRHIAGVHEGLKRYKCTVKECSQSFTRSEQLARHMISAHGQEKPHKCTRCKRTFARKGDLKKHSENVHEGIKRFVNVHNKFICTDTKCTQSFCSESLLAAHIDDVHGKGKPQEYQPLPKRRINRLIKR